MELNIDFFHIRNDLQTEKGKVLVSEPFLSDRYFKRSVVYICEHNSEGSLGFVLNKPLDIRISEVVDDFPDQEFPLGLGGPVAPDTLNYIHTLGSRLPDSVPIGNGIFWGGDFDLLKEVISEGSVRPHQLRFFLGYAGWSPEQLDAEMQDHAWLLTRIKPRNIMTLIDADLWTSTLENYQNKYRAWANFPEDPVLN